MDLGASGPHSKRAPPLASMYGVRYACGLTTQSALVIGERAVQVPNPMPMGEMWRLGHCFHLQVVGRILMVAFVPMVTLMKHVHRKASEAGPDYHLGE